MATRSKISDPSNLTLEDLTNVQLEILQSAIKAEKLNQSFFWAASEMVTPAVNLKTCFSSKTAFLDILQSDRIGRANDAANFVHGMEKSYELGTGNMDADLRDRVSGILSRIRQVYPSGRGLAA